MPGKSGIEVANEIRALATPLNKIPLLAFSSAPLSILSKYQESGFDGFLPKPIKRKKMLKMVEQLLNQKNSLQQDKITSNIITQYTIAEEQKRSTKILLAEDNPINQKLARFMLTKAGYDLTIANNGEELVDVFTKNPGNFDLIFMRAPKHKGRIKVLPL